MQRNPAFDLLFAEAVLNHAPELAAELQKQKEQSEKNQSQNIDKQNQFNHQKLFNQQPKHQSFEMQKNNHTVRYQR